MAGMARGWGSIIWIILSLLSSESLFWTFRSFIYPHFESGEVSPLLSSLPWWLCLLCLGQLHIAASLASLQFEFASNELCDGYDINWLLFTFLMRYFWNILRRDKIVTMVYLLAYVSHGVGLMSIFRNCAYSNIKCRSYIVEVRNLVKLFRFFSQKKKICRLTPWSSRIRC